MFGGALRCRPGRIGDGDGMAWADAVVAQLTALPEMRLLRATTIVGQYDGNYLVAVERIGELLGPAAPAGLPRARLWHIRAPRVRLSARALERPTILPRHP